MADDELDLTSGADRGTGWAGVEAVQALLDEFPGGSVVSYLIDRMPGVQIEKAAKMMELLLGYAGVNSTALNDRIEGDPNLRRLVWEAMRSAADTELEEKINALAFVASRAVADDAKIDEARFIVRTLAQVEALHIDALARLNERPASGVQDEDIVDLRTALSASPGIVEAITTDLTRLTLAETSGLEFRTVNARLYRSPYGAEILSFLRATNTTNS